MIELRQKRKLVSAAVLAAGMVGLGLGQSVLQHKAEAQGASVQAPKFEVNPLWPKPLPNNWLLGWTIGIWVDEQDHVWIIHRGAGGLHNAKAMSGRSPTTASMSTTKATSGSAAMARRTPTFSNSPRTASS